MKAETIKELIDYADIAIQAKELKDQEMEMRVDLVNKIFTEMKSVAQDNKIKFSEEFEDEDDNSYTVKGEAKKNSKLDFDEGEDFDKVFEKFPDDLKALFEVKKVYKITPAKIKNYLKTKNPNKTFVDMVSEKPAAPNLELTVIEN